MALVTGSKNRLGEIIALKLAENGSDIIVHSRSQPDNNEMDVVNKIQNMGRHAVLTHHDLEVCDGTTHWFTDLSQQHSGIDILVNSACDYPQDTYDEVNFTSLTRAMAAQVLSPLAMMRAMKQSGRPGTVVNILDTRYADRDPSHASYHLAKRALHAVTCDLAVEYAPDITVNAVAPGIILQHGEKDESWMERMAASNPLNTCGNPHDVAEAVLYLVQASFVTGQVIFVDGGRHLKANIYGH